MSIYTKIYIYAVGILGICINGIYHIIDMQTLMRTNSIHESITSIISWLYRRTWTPKTEILGHFGKGYF